MLALAACDPEVETWEGNLLARGWDRLPAYESRPDVQVTHSSQDRCHKGITALENQWKDYLERMGKVAQANLEYIKHQRERLFGVNTQRPPTSPAQAAQMAEQIEEKLYDGQVRAEHERLGKEEVTALNELEAIVLVKNSLYGECRIISYTEVSS